MTPPDAATLEAAEAYAGKFTWNGIIDLRVKAIFLGAVAWRDAHPKAPSATPERPDCTCAGDNLNIPCLPECPTEVWRNEQGGHAKAPDPSKDTAEAFDAMADLHYAHGMKQALVMLAQASSDAERRAIEDDCRKIIEARTRLALKVLKRAKAPTSDEDEADLQQCESCQKEFDIEQLTRMEGTWICAACYAEWRAEFDVCQHEWSPRLSEHGEPGRICEKSNGFVLDDEGDKAPEPTKNAVEMAREYALSIFKFSKESAADDPIETGLLNMVAKHWLAGHAAARADNARALEFAEYMAKAIEVFLDAWNSVMDSDVTTAAHTDALGDACRAAKSSIYEFRKRALKQEQG